MSFVQNKIQVIQIISFLHATDDRRDVRSIVAEVDGERSFRGKMKLGLDFVENVGWKSG
jgi:hypothetical protein